MAKRDRANERNQDAVEWLALALERSRFTDSIQQLQSTRTLLWKNFLIGLVRGFGAIIGATLVVALVVTLLAVLGDNLPGEIGDFFTKTSQEIQPSL